MVEREFSREDNSKFKGFLRESTIKVASVALAIGMVGCSETAATTHITNKDKSKIENSFAPKPKESAKEDTLIKKTIDDYKLTAQEVKAAAIGALASFIYDQPANSEMIIKNYKLTEVDVHCAALIAFESDLETSGFNYKSSKLSKEYKLTGHEINSAASRAYESNMKDGDEGYSAAAEIAQKYGLGEGKVHTAALNAYQYSIDNDEYMEAIAVANDYKLSQWRIVNAATKGYDYLMESGEYKRAIKMVEIGKLGQAKMHDAATKLLQENIEDSEK